MSQHANNWYRRTLAECRALKRRMVFNLARQTGRPVAEIWAELPSAKQREAAAVVEYVFYPAARRVVPRTPALAGRPVVFALFQN